MLWRKWAQGKPDWKELHVLPNRYNTRLALRCLIRPPLPIRTVSVLLPTNRDPKKPRSLAPSVQWRLSDIISFKVIVQTGKGWEKIPEPSRFLIPRFPAVAGEDSGYPTRGGGQSQAEQGVWCLHFDQFWLEQEPGEVIKRAEWNWSCKGGISGHSVGKVLDRVRTGKSNTEQCTTGNRETGSKSTDIESVLKNSVFLGVLGNCVAGWKSKIRRETCSRLTAERCLLSPEGSLTEWDVLLKVNWGQLSRWGVLLHEASIVTLAFTIISEYIIAWVIFVSVFSSNEFLLPWLEWRKSPGSHAVAGKKDWCSWVHTWPRRGLTGGTGPLLVLNNIPSHLLQAAGIWGMRP